MIAEKKALLGAAVVLLSIVAYTFVPKNAVVNIGNQTCPVSGREVDGVHTFIHKGKEYNLCSEKCTIPLLKDPDKYTSSFEN